MSITKIKQVKFGAHHKPARIIYSTGKQITSIKTKIDNGKKSNPICGLHVPKTSTVYVALDDPAWHPSNILLHELVHHMDMLAGMGVVSEPLVEDRGRILLEFILNNKSLIQSIWKQHKKS